MAEEDVKEVRVSLTIRPTTNVVRYQDGRYKIIVTLPPLSGIRKTEKELSIMVDPEYGINVAATGDLHASEIGGFTEALELAQRISEGTLRVNA